MTYWKLKSCPRCRGDLFVEKGDHTSTAFCLQCGARTYVTVKPREKLAIEECEKELVAAK